MSSVMTLALWRWRQTGFLLLITTIGMIAAVVIACAVPLFSDVMTTAGLRNTLREAPNSSELQLNAGTQGLSTQIVNNVHDQFDGLFKQHLGSLVLSSPDKVEFTIVTSDFSFAASPRQQRSMIVYSASMQQAASHLAHIQGRLANVVASRQNNTLEVMLTPETAKGLGVQVGSDIPLHLQFYTKQPDLSGRNASLPPQYTLNVTAHVAGLFSVDPANAAYWHGEDFKPLAFSQGNQVTYTYTMLVPNEGLLALFDHLRTIYHSDALYTLSGTYALRWYYHLDPSRVSAKNFDTLVDQLAALQTDYTTNYGDLAAGLSSSDTPPAFPYLSSTSLFSSLFSTNDTPSNLQRFRSRTDVANIPVGVLTIQIILLILFFVSLMTNLLVDRQTETIAVLRSRGASSGQIFGALLTQSTGQGVLALLIGVPLAIFTVIVVAQRILPASEQDAIDVITSNLLQTVQGVVWYAVALLAVVLLTMAVSLFFAARMDVLAIRRESARTKKRPLWQRLNLDIIAGVVAFVGYGLSLYVTSINNVLGSDAKTLIATPLSIIAPFFIIVGVMFLFLRIFPLILRFAAYLASRGRGAVSMLALAQIARSPRQSIRMTMLLALATAFGLFTLIYNATQAQHIQDVATYQTGADFSGELAYSGGQVDIVKTTQMYQAIPGVISTTVGYTALGTGGTAALPMQIRAVDAATFANTAIWSSPQAFQTGSVLLNRLVLLRSTAVRSDIVPAIIDASTMNKLHLQVGSPFLVKVNGLNLPNMHCTIIGSVPHIPTVNELTAQGTSSGFIVNGSVLVDYATYAAVYNRDLQGRGLMSLLDAPTANHVWLRTRDDAASLASVRTALNKRSLRLDNLVDRRQMVADLKNDPLYLVLASLLSIGTVTALLLALIGDLLASWLSARTRLTNFAILRAIGTTPQQVASMLSWEQAIVYLVGLLLGIGFGMLLSLTVIPSLTFTNLNSDLSNGQFYALQTTISTPIVVPVSLPLALIVIVGIYIVALTMMIRVVSQPSLNQVLRLNED